MTDPQLLLTNALEELKRNNSAEAQYRYASLTSIFVNLDYGFSLLAQITNLKMGAIRYDAGMFQIIDQEITACTSNNIVANASLGPHFIKDSLCFLFASDEKYFERFAEKLIRSLKLYSPKCKILIGISCSRDSFRSFQERYREYDDISLMHADLPNFGPDGDRVYYSCLRYYVYMHLISSATVFDDSLVVLLDIDMTQMRPLDDLLVTCRKNDVSLLVYATNVDNIMSLISGSLVILKPSDKSVRFVTEIIRHFNQCFSRGSVSWHLDQIGLALAFLRCRNLDYFYLPTDSIRSEPFVNIDYLNSAEAYFHSSTASITLPR